MKNRKLREMERYSIFFLYEKQNILNQKLKKVRCTKAAAHRILEYSKTFSVEISLKIGNNVYSNENSSYFLQNILIFIVAF